MPQISESDTKSRWVLSTPKEREDFFACSRLTAQTSWIELTGLEREIMVEKYNQFVNADNPKLSQFVIYGSFLMPEEITTESINRVFAEHFGRVTDGADFSIFKCVPKADLSGRHGDVSGAPDKEIEDEGRQVHPELSTPQHSCPHCSSASAVPSHKHLRQCQNYLEATICEECHQAVSQVYDHLESCSMWLPF